MKHLPIAAALLLAASVTVGAQGRGDQGRGDEGRGRGRGRGDDNHGQQVSQAEQDRRIAEERQRQIDYQNRLNAQIRAAQQQQAQLQAQHRAAELAQHQRYVDALQRQQQELRAERDYARDPYIAAPPTYRYRYDGTTYSTNQYGVDVLRAAVNNGYAQCYSQGQADRQDGRSSNYRRSFAYQDANYGYSGRYIAQNEYNYYFRQGCQRGYQDGFASTTRYGSNGSILGNLVNSILGLVSIR